MLDDLKSFFTTSSVAEVGVGVTIGAAFAALVAAIVESVRALISGDVDFSSVATAAATLLAVALFSLFGVVRPLLALKEKMGRVQAAKVAEAVQQARSGDLSGAAGTAAGVARGAGVPLPGGSGDAEDAGATSGDDATGDADPAAGTATGTAADGVVADGTGTTGGGALVVHADGTTSPAQDVPASGDELTVDSATTDGAGTGTAAAAGAVAGGTAAAAYDPLFGPIGDVQQQSGAGSSSEDEEPAVAGAGLTTAPRSAPHAATTTKACPYCAFDIPAVATRCGWCTSDLGDLERGPDPVLVEG